ncbi:MAG: transposase [Candidatus Brocadiae bacterium]|nr:transposase [Candidatus Brocadiia bacterium]
MRKRWHIPEDRVFQSKPQIALDMVKAAKANHFPFKIVDCDSVYGCDTEFRIGLNDENILYIADIHSTTPIYLNRPVVGIPQTPEGRRGRPYSKYQVLSEEKFVEPRSLIETLHFDWVFARDTERGGLTIKCATRRVWIVADNGKILEESLFVRQESNGEYRFSLSNLPVSTSLEEMACYRCKRYFVERTFQDAKSELGWDELVARKYRAWMHHAALTSLALWFASEIKLDWAVQYPRDPELSRELEISNLPSLSIANIRELLKAVLPLPTLTLEDAIHIVIKHFLNRSRSKACRRRQERRRYQFT